MFWQLITPACKPTKLVLGEYTRKDKPSSKVHLQRTTRRQVSCKKYLKIREYFTNPPRCYDLLRFELAWSCYRVERDATASRGAFCSAPVAVEAGAASRRADSAAALRPVLASVALWDAFSSSRSATCFLLSWSAAFSSALDAADLLAAGGDGLRGKKRNWERLI